MKLIETICAWVMVAAIAACLVLAPFAFLAGAFAVGTYYGELAYTHEIQAERAKAMADYAKWLRGKIKEFEEKNHGEKPLNQYPEGTL